MKGAAIYGVLLLVAGIVAWLSLRQTGRRSVPRIRPVQDALHTACMGDAAQAQRLERHERRFALWMSRRTARKRALERLTRDRGGRW